MSFSQNVDEIINKHLKAHGDIDKWETIESMEITGRFAAFSVEEDFYCIKTDKGEYYSELFLGQHKVYEGFDGNKGWSLDPWQELGYPRELNKAEVNVFLQKADFFSPFYKYEEKGSEVKLLENKDVDGMPMYVIELTRKDGGSETWYLDVNTYLEYKCESGWVDFAYPSPAETYFDDFRDVDGLIIPHFVERTFSQRDRILQIEKIAFNVEVNPELFIIAKSEEMKKIAFLEGIWDVKVDVMTRRGNWYNVDNTTSEIAWEATNMLQEKIQYDQTFVQSKVVSYTYNSTASKYVMAIYSDFTSNYVLFQAEMNDSSLIAKNINVNYGDTNQVDRFTKIVLGDISEDGFTIIRLMSPDQGIKWNARQKLTYTRKTE